MQSDPTAVISEVKTEVSEQGAVRHRIEYGNGFTVVEDNIVDLANKIETLYSNPALRKEMGQNSRKLVDEKLGSRMMNRRFMDLFPNLQNTVTACK